MNKSLNIFVVDDEPYISRSLSFVLKQEGFQVTTTNNGEKAWNLLTNGAKPELIFLDVMMPGLTGYELCKMIKTTDHLKNIYVILLTARWQEKDRNYAEQVGADEYITKPFSPSDIIRRVNELRPKLSGETNE